MPYNYTKIRREIYEKEKEKEKKLLVVQELL